MHQFCTLYVNMRICIEMCERKRTTLVYAKRNQKLDLKLDFIHLLDHLDYSRFSEKELDLL